MNKIMLSMREEAFLTVSAQAKTRDISIQELLRAVIVPEWVDANLRPSATPVRKTKMPTEPIVPQTHPYHRDRILEITVGQLKY